MRDGDAHAVRGIGFASYYKAWVDSSDSAIEWPVNEFRSAITSSESWEVLYVRPGSWVPGTWLVGAGKLSTLHSGAGARAWVLGSRMGGEDWES